MSIADRQPFVAPVNKPAELAVPILERLKMSDSGMSEIKIFLAAKPE
jgi:hypothetical protein